MPQDGPRVPEPQSTDSPAEDAPLTASQMLDRYLIKTVLRLTLWLLLAAVLVHYFPSLRWIWYIATAFGASSLLVICFLFVLAKKEKAAAGRR